MYKHIHHHQNTSSIRTYLVLKVSNLQSICIVFLDKIMLFKALQRSKDMVLNLFRQVISRGFYDDRSFHFNIWKWMLRSHHGKNDGRSNPDEECTIFVLNNQIIKKLIYNNWIVKIKTTKTIFIPALVRIYIYFCTFCVLTNVGRTFVRNIRQYLEELHV